MPDRPCFFSPRWPAPENVGAVMSYRYGGVSQAGWASLNLGAHSGDSMALVEANRERFYAEAQIPAEPQYLRQVHGNEWVWRHSNHAASLTPAAADAQATAEVGMPLAVFAADCLPVLFCDEQGEKVAAAHAGWRGLQSGVLLRTVREMRTVLPARRRILAWVGPSIGACHFVVGEDVRQAFMQANAAWAAFFTPVDTCESAVPSTKRYRGDLAAIARRQLESVAVDVTVDGRCTYCCEDLFFSYRRDGVCGRMAAVIWRKFLGSSCR